MSTANPLDAIVQSSEPDLRTEHRTMMLFREAVLEADTRVGLCVIKNISAGGAMIQTQMELSVGAPVTLVMSSGRRAAGVLKWQQSALGGVMFDTEMSVSRLLERFADPADRGRCRRLPRVNIAAVATATDDNGVSQALTCDISTHGVRLAVDRTLAVGPVVIDLKGLGCIRAKVLWSANGQSGCVFDQPFSIEEITGWLRVLEDC